MTREQRDKLCSDLICFINLDGWTDGYQVFPQMSTTLGCLGALLFVWSILTNDQT